MREKVVLWSMIVIALVVIGFCFRWTFVYKFDPIYWENFYYTSQWNIPNSKRVIGDEGVYRYIGYRLVNGENPFNVDYWVPPLGKYWYGAAAKYLGNPYWASWGWYAILLILAYKITKKLWVLLLVMTNPLIVAQIGMTMLDLPQAVFLLAHVACLFMGNYMLAGVMLGLMMGVKIGVFVPMVAMVGMYYLYKKTKSKIKILVFILAIPMGYVLAYTCYFLAHPNPIPWIRLHGKVIEFWKNSGAVAHPLNIFGYIFIDKFNQVRGEGRVWMTVNEWSFLFPVAIIIMMRNSFSKNNLESIYYLLLAGGWLGMCALIDFWPRYLVAIVPILAIITVDFMKNKKRWLVLLLIVNLFSLKNVLWSTPKTEMEGIKRNLKLENYREIWEMGSNDFKTKNTVHDIEKLKESSAKIERENGKWVIVKIGG
ncbi:MAG: hypothetical protein WC069_05295 [Candidatus Shapirobacteria bacterium]